MILALIGTAALSASITAFVQQRRARRGVIVTGTVVDVSTSPGGRVGDAHRTTYHAPIVEYTDAAGATHRVASRLSASTRPDVGASRQVAYRPDDPSRAVLVERGSERAAKWAFLVVGLAALAGAVVAAVR